MAYKKMYCSRMVLGPFVLVPFERAKLRRGRSPFESNLSKYRDKHGADVDLELVFHASTGKPMWALPGGGIATTEELGRLARRKCWVCQVVRVHIGMNSDARREVEMPDGEG